MDSATSCFSVLVLLAGAIGCTDTLEVAPSPQPKSGVRSDRDRDDDRDDSGAANDANSDAAQPDETGGASGAGGVAGVPAAGASAAGRGAAGTHAAGGGAGAAGRSPVKSPVCEAGEFKCVDDTVHECNASRTEFVARANVKGPCGSGLCNEELGTCNACAPGSITCTEDGIGVRTCSDDGQAHTTRACEAPAPYCIEGVCRECRMDSDPSNTGCAAGNECTRSGSTLMCRPVNGASSGLDVQFCHAGACKVTLAPGFDLDLKADWSACEGSASQAPLGAPSVGVMLWPTTLTDLAIPLADSGWFCKLAPLRGGDNGCVINASQTTRDLYIWGPIENTCTYAWRRTPSGIAADVGAGCGMCTLAAHPEQDAAEYAFNMGIDRSCRCPKFRFAAVPAKRSSQ